jgi:predicted GNAT superfamily acetyltransferase
VPCSLEDVYRRFRGAYNLYHKDDWNCPFVDAGSNHFSNVCILLPYYMAQRRQSRPFIRSLFNDVVSSSNSSMYATIYCNVSSCVASFSSVVFIRFSSLLTNSFRACGYRQLNKGECVHCTESRTNTLK